MVVGLFIAVKRPCFYQGVHGYLYKIFIEVDNGVGCVYKIVKSKVIEVRALSRAIDAPKRV